MPHQQDTQIIRELAKRYRDLAALPQSAERKARIRRVNGLTPDRPAVWIAEIPWNEMDIDGQLQLHCEDAFARRIEWNLREALFRWRYFQADMVLEETYYIDKAYTSTVMGMDVEEKTIATDAANNIISHQYEDQLDTDAKLDALKAPVLAAQSELDAQRLETAQTMLDGILPVALRGHGIYYAPWDYISRLRGVEPILIDMIEEPEFVHRIIARFTEFYTSVVEQMEALGLLAVNIPSLHCTPPYVDDLPAKDFDGTHVRLKDVWFRGMAQIFGSVSPAMHDEFDLQYMRPIMERCGLSYYGCCEPLDRMIPYLKKVPNMRKIGVSPWADVRGCAEQLGGDYVLARKPNPALVAGTFDKDAVRRETIETVEACLANGCPYELVLKDISTVGYRPQNLIDWNDTVQAVLDSYYA